MISAVQEQERQRQKARSAASGPPFSIPLMPALDGLSAVSLPSGPSCVAPELQASSSTSVAPGTDLTGLVGRSVGSGQCVALVQAATAVGHTSGWSPGAAVQGNTALKPGTPIATFDGNRYANATDGSSHAAIYLGQNAQGMQVLDQWAGSNAAVRTIPWNNPGAAPANTGSAFRVVKTT